MTVIGLDDTDSRTLGMCTTYVATRFRERIEAAGGAVDRMLLVRLNPAVEHKTRGNAALAIHCDLDTGTVLEIADELLDMAATADEQTNPGVVVADCQPDAVPDAVARFASGAVRTHHDLDAAEELIEDAGFESRARGIGRGRIGALAAVGAWAAFDEWTYECISYRERDRWGTDLGHARTGDPELIKGIPTPGEGFDLALRSASSVHEISGRETVTERLEAVGVTVLQRRRGYTESEARERLESGEWTDDPVAAAFFDGTGWAAFPLSFRLRVRLGEESKFGLKARRATEELERIWTRTEDTDE